MFDKLFKKDKGIKVFSPFAGEVVTLSEAPDPVFAGGHMGAGVCIKPSSGTVVSPVDGEVVTLFPSKHAVGIKTAEGLELLIHVGINTVELNGEGFQAYVEQGASVKAGDKLLEVDLELVESKGYSLVTPIVVTNTDDFSKVEATDAETVLPGDEVLTIKK